MIGFEEGGGKKGGIRKYAEYEIQNVAANVWKREKKGKRSTNSVPKARRGRGAEGKHAIQKDILQEKEYVGRLRARRPPLAFMGNG